MPKIIFPKNFLWGAATSAHQIEGGNKNDWSEWEKANAERLAHLHQKMTGEFNPQSHISGRAADHFHLFEKDFDIARSLNHNAHRFSIEWSRLEPREGEFDQRAIEHYQRVVGALRERGIEPFVTLYHWTLPRWFVKKGSWLDAKAVFHFSRYVKAIGKALSGKVKFWNTLNEPTLYAGQSFLAGTWPPQERSIFKYFKVIERLVEAHRLAYRSLRSIDSECQVGLSGNCTYFDGGLLKYPARHLINRRFFDKVGGEQDFIGLQYYFHRRFGWLGIGQNENRRTSDLGWEIYPKGIYHTLLDLKRYDKPIYITENGLADAKDKKRKSFIRRHLRWTHKAIEKGADVRGYFHWSLLDNFEWDKGFWPRFGLVEVDYRTMERKIRPSARYFAKICKSNSIEL